MLLILRDKFPDWLNDIESRTMNTPLSILINKYKSIQVVRDDFNARR
jgi:hypothetical protein